MNCRASIERVSSNESAVMMNIIADNELSIFDVHKYATLREAPYNDFKPMLRRLVRDGQLFRIEKGLYCVRNFRNPYVIGEAESRIAILGNEIISNLAT